MATAKNLEKYLENNRVKFKIIEHKKVFTAHDSAETQHIKLGEVAKGVLLKGKKSLFIAVLPAAHNCDFKSLSKIIKEKVGMAKEKDIASKLKTKVGLITPFGSLYNLPVYMDKKLIKNKKLNLPAGSYTESVTLSVKDYVKLEQPILGNFSVKK
jgi:Ala-tRNA(Pro) deacylase